MCQNKERNILPNQINLNCINSFSSQNNDNIKDMDLVTVKNDFSYSNRTNSCFSSLFQEEDQKITPNNPNNIDNLFSYIIPNIPNINNIKENNNNNNINIINKIQFQNQNEKYPFSFNKESNINNNISSNINNNFFIPNFNTNQIINNEMNNLPNQSRFINYFKMNENNNFIQNINNNIITNNNIINNNLSKNESYKYNYDNSNLNNNMGIKNNNYIDYDNNSNNLNYLSQNNLNFNDYTNKSNININNKNTINNIYINNNNITNNNINNNIVNSNSNITNTNSSISNNIGVNNIIIPNSILSRNVDYQEFLNYVNSLNVPLIKFLCTKKGINEMQNYLNAHKKNNIEILIYVLNKEGLTKLMKHKFGNYFMQEIIKDAKYPQIKLILELILNNFVEISESNSGTHVLQTLLDKVNTFELRDLVLKSIENKELEMAFNNNATYVLQKIIGIVPDNERLNLNEIIINNVINLALDSDCIFIVEKFITTITIKENKEKIKNIICENCIQLATSPFGNYLIQYLFQVWKNDDIEPINNIVIDNANFLAKQRYSSNVIEKAIDIYDNKIKPRLIRSLSLGGDILEIIKNQYGHYVLNKAVKFMDEGLKLEIETILNSKMPDMTKKEKTKSKKFIANLKKNGKGKKNLKNTKK